MTKWAKHSKWIGAGAFALTAASVSAAGITLYEGRDFQGHYVTTNASIAIVGSPAFANAASSMVVSEGVWEACTDANFRGRCVQLPPGNYPRVDADLNGRIASVRQVADAARATAVIVNPQPVVVNSTPLVVDAPVARSTQAVVINPAPTTANQLPPVIVDAQPAVVIPSQVVTVARPPTGRVVLYEYPNFAGARVIVDRGQAKDLDWTNFSYGHRATSIRVESGTWMFCSEMNFQGECRLFGPGEYPQLSGPLVAGISSAQQVWRQEYGALTTYSR